jgi:hypothetical protein
MVGEPATLTRVLEMVAPMTHIAEARSVHYFDFIGSSQI